MENGQTSCASGLSAYAAGNEAKPPQQVTIYEESKEQSVTVATPFRQCDESGSSPVLDESCVDESRDVDSGKGAVNSSMSVAAYKEPIDALKLQRLTKS